MKRYASAFVIGALVALASLARIERVKEIEEQNEIARDFNLGFSCAEAAAGRGCGPCDPWRVPTDGVWDVYHSIKVGEFSVNAGGYLFGSNSSMGIRPDGSTSNGITYTANEANGATAVAHTFDNATTIADAAGVLLRVRNNGTTKAWVDPSGNVAAPQIRGTSAGSNVEIRDGSGSLIATFASPDDLVMADDIFMPSGGVIWNTSTSGDNIQFTASGIDYRTLSSKPHIFYSTGTERARFDDSGLDVAAGSAFTVGGGGSVVKIGRYSATWDPGSITDTCTSTTIAATGVAAGDACTASQGGVRDGMSWLECRATTDNVTIYTCSHGASNQVSQTFYATTLEF